MIARGMVGFSNNRISLLGKLIRFFTDSRISHTFITTFEQNGEVMIEEASTVVWEGTFRQSYRESEDSDYYLFKIKDGFVTQAEMDASLKYCHDNFLGDTYGKLQLLYFPYRWFMETFFNKDVRHEKNWFTVGVICSELVYWYLYNLGPRFQGMLESYNPDTIQAQDIFLIVQTNPDVFEFVEKKILSDKP